MSTAAHILAGAALPLPFWFWLRRGLHPSPWMLLDAAPLVALPIQPRVERLGACDLLGVGLFGGTGYLGRGHAHAELLAQCQRRAGRAVVHYLPVYVEGRNALQLGLAARVAGGDLVGPAQEGDDRAALGRGHSRCYITPRATGVTVWLRQFARGAGVCHDPSSSNFAVVFSVTVSPATRLQSPPCHQHYTARKYDGEITRARVMTDTCSSYPH